MTRVKLWLFLFLNTDKNINIECWLLHINYPLLKDNGPNSAGTKNQGPCGKNWSEALVGQNLPTNDFKICWNNIYYLKIICHVACLIRFDFDFLYWLCSVPFWVKTDNHHTHDIRNGSPNPLVRGPGALSHCPGGSYSPGSQPYHKI